MTFFSRYYKKGKLDPKKRAIPIYVRFFLPIIGFLALLWFLIRVIPKPNRAGYPCQRIAFPLASGFVLWLAGLLGSLVFLRKAQKHIDASRRWIGLLCIAISIFCLWLTMSITSSQTVKADDPIPNDPNGIAKGLYPGRVVWIHDPNATDWDGPGIPGNYFWQPEHTVQKYVDAMVSKALRQLSGCDTDIQAWDTIFRHFNSNHGKGDIGYMPGEKVTIKVNLTTCNVNLWTVDPATCQKTDYLDRPDTSPQVICAIIRQLVNCVGVEPNDIAVGDTLTYFPNQWLDLLTPEFPEVIYFDKVGFSGRTQSTPSQIVQHWSHGLDPNDFETDFIPSLYAEADYLVNIAVLKSHGAGITLCAKNHYGSYNRTPDDVGYYDLHPSLAGSNPNPGQYRTLVDIMGHPHMGAKTLLYMLDGLYGGDNWSAYPYKFNMDPFNNDWPSSIIVSQDPVAIDSVGLDILWSEGWSRVRNAGGVDDYLKEAAQANNPPSNTLYDPDGDQSRLDSLGVHERWNNAMDRQYSRNLGTGDGIELVYYRMKHDPGDLDADETVTIYDMMRLADRWLWTGPKGQILEDMLEDGKVNLKDFQILAEQWGRQY